MELIKKVNAYMALSVLAKEKFSYSDAYKIATLHMRLRDDFEFFRKEELALVERVAEKNENGAVKKNDDGYFTFESEKAKEEYQKEMTELSMLQTEDVEKITINPPDELTPTIIETLLGFVIFEEKQA